MRQETSITELGKIQRLEIIETMTNPPLAAIECLFDLPLFQLLIIEASYIAKAKLLVTY